MILQYKVGDKPIWTYEEYDSISHSSFDLTEKVKPYLVNPTLEEVQGIYGDVSNAIAQFLEVQTDTITYHVGEILLRRLNIVSLVMCHNRGKYIGTKVFATGKQYPNGQNSSVYLLNESGKTIVRL